MASVLERTQPKETSRVTSQFFQDGDIGGVYGGVRVQGNATVEEAMDLGGLNWEAEMHEVYSPFGKIPGYRSVVRGDTQEALGIVKGKYVPIQNAKAFEWIEDLVGKNKASITSAGVIGPRTFVNVDLGEDIEVLPGDALKRHLLVVNSFDGSSNMLIKPMDHRIACQNQLDAVMSRGKSDIIAVRHTTGHEEDLVNAAQVLEFSHRHFEEVERRFKDFAKIEVDHNTTQMLVRKALEVSDEELAKWNAGELARQPKWVNNVQKVLERIQYGPGANIAPGSLWNTFNGINGFFDHERTVRNGNNEANGKAVQWESRFNGVSAEGKLRAYKVASEYAKMVLKN